MGFIYLLLFCCHFEWVANFLVADKFGANIWLC